MTEKPDYTKDKGDKGDKGDQGDPSTVPGPPGKDSTVPGPQGPPGEDSTVPGPKGDKGDQGDPGTTTWAGITDKPTTFTPEAHKTDHQDGGTDEISVEGLAGELAAAQKSSWAKVADKPTTFTPEAHKTSHQDGGSDALDLTGLTGSVTAASVQAALEQAWTTPAFNAADFTGQASMTWTVEAADVAVFSYKIIGKSIFVSFILLTTTIGGTPSYNLYTKIPAGKTATKATYSQGMVYDGGVWVPAFFFTLPSDSRIGITKPSGTLFSAAANACYVYGSLFFEIN